MVIGKTYKFMAAIKAVKSPDLEGSPTAKPGILIHYVHWDDLGYLGTGSLATVTHPEGPIMAVAADGDYEWYASVSYARQDFWINQVVSEIIENTMIYISLENAVFQTKNDEFHVKVAENLDDACKLLEIGFEYVTEMDGKKLFRKRK